MRKLLIAVALMSIVAPLYAANLVVSNAWVRLLPGDLPLAGYVHVMNNSTHEVTLVSASSPDFATVQFHQSMNHAGMEEMMHLAKVSIPAGKSLDFAPGGYHLMLMGRKQPLAVGQHVALTLHFADGSKQTIQFVVKGATGK